MPKPDIDIIWPKRYQCGNPLSSAVRAHLLDYGAKSMSLGIRAPEVLPKLTPQQQTCVDSLIAWLNFHRDLYKMLEPVRQRSQQTPVFHWQSRGPRPPVFHCDGGGITLYRLRIRWKNYGTKEVA